MMKESTRRMEQRSKMEKRKSEVLIAAQSLDQEVQHVKNLKRLSIGSIDLLVDPEMEYRVSNQQTNYTEKGSSDGTSGTFSKQGTSSDVSMEEEVEDSSRDLDEEDSYSFTEDSLEATNVEYLDQNYSGSTQTLQTTYNKEPVLKRRILGSISLSNGEKTLKARGKELDDNIGSTSIGQNLFWVRADQHPNVRPESYLQLVQNTLEHLNLDEQNVESQAQSLDDLKKLRRRSLQQKSSLSRRTSRLRTSYTELSDEEFTSEECRAEQTKRTVSLKEITEELTKLSNKAGLTDTDAVALARSLRVAGEVTGQSENETFDDNPTSPNEDLASSILIKNGLMLPRRHSLRRSKFNTYRIRSSSPSSQDSVEDCSKLIPQNTTLRSSTNSPNSIIGMYNDNENDNDYYNDHYNAHDNDNSRKNIEKVFSKIPKTDSAETESSSEEFDSSTDFSNENAESPNKKDTDYETSLGWSWSQTSTNDFTQAQTIPDAKTSPRKTNHARHRHSQVIKTSESKEDPNLTYQSSTKTIKKSSPSQNKFIKFFKKKTSSENSKNENNKPTAKKDRAIKKKQSNTVLSSKFRISPKKQTKSESCKEEELKQKIHNEKQGSSTSAISKQTSLQPPVTVTKRSNKNQDIFQENINNGDTSQLALKNSTVFTDASFAQSSSYTPTQDDEFNIDITEKSLLDDSFNSIDESAHHDPNFNPQTSSLDLEESHYSLPPRKLVFEDVLKPSRPNSPMKFRDSAFGFPLPPLSISTVIMFDHRLPIHVERAIYRLSHLKLSDPKRELRQQVLLSNFMYSYLNLVNHSLYLQQIEEEKMGTPTIDTFFDEMPGT